MTAACVENASEETAKQHAAAVATVPPKDSIYVTVIGHPPRPDQEEFVEYLQEKLTHGYIDFKVKGVWFSVNYKDVEAGFVPPKSEAGLLKITNRIRRFIRNNSKAPMWTKNFAKHKVHHGFAMARVSVIAKNPPEKIEQWLEYFANNSSSFPEEIPLKTIRLVISPMDLYPKVLAFSKTIKRPVA